MLRCLILVLFANLCTMVRSDIVYTSNRCNFQKLGDGICICNATYCDTLDAPVPTQCGDYFVVTSSRAGKRFETQTTRSSESAEFRSDAFIHRLHINTTIRYQEMMGFGGAWTDATSQMVGEMSSALQQYLYQSYMSPIDGLAYDMLRIPIGASDFSEFPWTYNEYPKNDFNLTNMTTLHPLDQRRLEQIRAMQSAISGLDIRLMFAAWSSPKWMKSNNNWSGYSFLLPEYYEAWALYHTKYLELWRNESMHIWSVSLGNEPTLSGFVQFLSLGWRPNDQRRWLNDYLKPALSRSNMSDVLILGFDDLRSNLVSFVRGYQKNWRDTAIDNVDLIGVHWYFDKISSVNVLNEIASRYNKPVVYTESCTGVGLAPNDLKHGPIFGAWSRCMEYVNSMIDIFEHSVSGFIDWNMVLDETGGPNYVNNFADAPIIYHKMNETLIKQPMFYGIAHFSKFVRAGCVRVHSKLTMLSTWKIKATAFICDNNQTTVAILHNIAGNPEQITISQENNIPINVTLDPFSINTLVYKNCNISNAISDI